MIHEKLDKILEAISDIRVTAAKQEIHIENNTGDLKEHMRRTALAEARLDELSKPLSFKAFIGYCTAIAGTTGAFVTIINILMKLYGG